MTRKDNTTTLKFIAELTYQELLQKPLLWDFGYNNARNEWLKLPLYKRFWLRITLRKWSFIEKKSLEYRSEKVSTKIGDTISIRKPKKYDP